MLWMNLNVIANIIKYRIKFFDECNSVEVKFNLFQYLDIVVMSAENLYKFVEGKESRTLNTFLHLVYCTSLHSVASLELNAQKHKAH